MTRWHKMSRAEAKRLGIEGMWELMQMEKKEAADLNDLQENKNKKKKQEG